MNGKPFDEELAELRKYAELANDELGDACLLLCELWANRIHYYDPFVNALRREIQDSLSFFQQNTTIVEAEETIQRTIRALEYYKSEDYD